MPHASLVKVEHPPRSKRPNVVYLHNQLFVAPFHQRKGRLVEPAIANATELIAQVCLYCLSRDALQEFDFRLRLEDDAGEDINTIALALFST